MPSRCSPRANSATNNSVPPYFLGGTGINGGATRAIRIDKKEGTTLKMLKLERVFLQIRAARIGRAALVERRATRFCWAAKSLLISCHYLQLFAFSPGCFHSLLEFAGANTTGMSCKHALAGGAADAAKLVAIILRDVARHVFVPLSQQHFFAGHEEI